eukprot:PITA_13183
MKCIIAGATMALCSMVNFVGAEEDTCSGKDSECRNKTEALPLKIGALISILVAGTIGVCLPVLGRTFPALKPERNIFFVIKAFAAGVILATGFIHVLPDAFESLTSECLNTNPWGNFPFAGFIAMMAALCTLMVDALATGYYERSHLRNVNKENHRIGGADSGGGNDPELQNHNSHGHAYGSNTIAEGSTIRYRVIAQAGFKNKSAAVILMTFFFAVTTPFGIALGIGISSVYNENSPTALIVEGVFNSASSGILIYMALVDLIAPDFINSSRMKQNGALQVSSYLALLFGAGAMSLLAKWA